MISNEKRYFFCGVALRLLILYLPNMEHKTSLLWRLAWLWMLRFSLYSHLCFCIVRLSTSLPSSIFNTMCFVLFLVFFVHAKSSNLFLPASSTLGFPAVIKWLKQANHEWKTTNNTKHTISGWFLGILTSALVDACKHETNLIFSTKDIFYSLYYL